MASATVLIRRPPWGSNSPGQWRLVSKEFEVLQEGLFFEDRFVVSNVPPGEYWVVVWSNGDEVSGHLSVLSNHDHAITIDLGWHGRVSRVLSERKNSLGHDLWCQMYSRVGSRWVTTDTSIAGYWKQDGSLEMSFPKGTPSAVRIANTRGHSVIAILPTGSSLHICPRDDETTNGSDFYLAATLRSTNEHELVSLLMRNPVNLDDVTQDRVQSSELVRTAFSYCSIDNSYARQLPIDELISLPGADGPILASHAALIKSKGRQIDHIVDYLETASARGYPLFGRGVELFLKVWRTIRQVTSLSPGMEDALRKYTAIRASATGTGLFTMFTSSDPNDPSEQRPIERIGIGREIGSIAVDVDKDGNYTGREMLEIARSAGVCYVDMLSVPSKPPRRLPVPSSLHDSIRDVLSKQYPAGLWSHQSAAIESLLHGRSVCLATPTASGKSLVFQAAAADLLLRSEDARVLALYPAKALIRDQLDKWTGLLSRLGYTIARIDGSVEKPTRILEVESNRVILMTPDVAHAWLMSNLDKPAVAKFLSHLRILILDEAHVYDGLFGTNMAFFLRRLESVASEYRIVCSTATISNPGEFVEKLTGRQMDVFDSAHDGALAARRSILLARNKYVEVFDAAVSVLTACTRLGRGRFLAFADSRTMVEHLVAEVHRVQRIGKMHDKADQDGEDDSTSEDSEDDEELHPDILPFRSGYEKEDRSRIQESLNNGSLRGVVSTSALEIGLDIGEIDLVILLGYPKNMKAFWQRLGRAGRKRSGVCLVLEGSSVLLRKEHPLRTYVTRSIEPSWLYLDNRYVQYSHALCAAQESRFVRRPLTQTSNLPRRFIELLANELEPEERLPPDLFQLKQRLQGGIPQHEFPIRSSIEKNYHVSAKGGRRLGTLSFSQVLREAYPGALYYYMAKPYRVVEVNRRKSEIIVYRTRGWRTRPIRQVRAFPNFETGSRQVRRSEFGFVSETEMQVSERVLGFYEYQGNKTIEVKYGVGSSYCQGDFSRFFETTGVCISWDSPGSLPMYSSEVSDLLLRAFCLCYGVESRDLGGGEFVSKRSPHGNLPSRGYAIYDATYGSLRLTERLVDGFSVVLDAAGDLVDSRTAPEVINTLTVLRQLADDLQEKFSEDSSGSVAPAAIDNFMPIEVISAGENAYYYREFREVVVLGHRLTGYGLMYQVESANAGVTQLVGLQELQRLHGGRTSWIDPFTGKPIENAE